MTTKSSESSTTNSDPLHHVDEPEIVSQSAHVDDEVIINHQRDVELLTHYASRSGVMDRRDFGGSESEAVVTLLQYLNPEGLVEVQTSAIRDVIRMLPAEVNEDLSHLGPPYVEARGELLAFYAAKLRNRTSIDVETLTKLVSDTPGLTRHVHQVVKYLDVRTGFRPALNYTVVLYLLPTIALVMGLLLSELGQDRAAGVRKFRWGAWTFWPIYIVLLLYFVTPQGFAALKTLLPGWNRFITLSFLWCGSLYFLCMSLMWWDTAVVFSNDTSITLGIGLSFVFWAATVIVIMSPSMLQLSEQGTLTTLRERHRLENYPVYVPQRPYIKTAKDIFTIIDSEVVFRFHGQSADAARAARKLTIGDLASKAAWILFQVACAAINATVPLWFRLLSKNESDFRKGDWFLYTAVALGNVFTVHVAFENTYFAATQFNFKVAHSIRTLSKMMSADDSAHAKLPYLPIFLGNNDLAVVALREFFVKYYSPLETRRSSALVGALLGGAVALLPLGFVIVLLRLYDIAAWLAMVFFFTLGLAAFVMGSVLYVNETLSANAMAIDRAIFYHHTRQFDPVEGKRLSGEGQSGLSTGLMVAAAAGAGALGGQVVGAVGGEVMALGAGAVAAEHLPGLVDYMVKHESKLTVLGIVVTRQTVMIIRGVFALVAGSAFTFVRGLVPSESTE